MRARFGFSIVCGVGAASLILPLAACTPPAGSGLVGALSDLLDDADPIDTFDGE